MNRSFVPVLLFTWFTARGLINIFYFCFPISYHLTSTIKNTNREQRIINQRTFGK